MRSEPGLTGLEVTRVDVGTDYQILEEGDGWIKIQIDESTEGWVSNTYVDIVDIDIGAEETETPEENEETTEAP